MIDRSISRRETLGLVAGGFAASTTAGVAGAQPRSTVTASSRYCELLTLEYSDRGPRVTVNADGPDRLETTLDRGESRSFPVSSGEYTVVARPAGSAERTSIDVVGSPVTVDECLPSGVIANLECTGADAGDLTFENPLDNCVAVRFERYADGVVARSGLTTVESGRSASLSLRFDRSDGWAFWAHLPRSRDDCRPSEATVPINGARSPLHLRGDDCTSTSLDG